MDSTPVDLLRTSVQRNPDAVALIFNNARIDYVHLWERVASVASFLRARGLTAADRVALVIDNSFEYVATYYGVLAAGGVAVALNTAAREHDLLNWIRHCGARWVFGQTAHPAWTALSRLTDGTRVVGIGEGSDSAWNEVLTTPAELPTGTIASPQSPAAIIYTSGTTGKPKGVTLSHANLVANTRSILKYLPIDVQSRTVNILPFYYSYGNSVLHTHLAAGAGLILENSFTYPHKVVERIAKEAATGFNGVPSTYALLLSRVNLKDYDLSSLRYLTQAGGAMSPVLVQQLVQALPQAKLFVMYGQTEASARLSYLPPERLADKSGSAGRAIPGVTLEVRAEDGTAVAPGVVGEVWACGGNVMLGYWNDTAATEAVLKDGWLRTGDMAAMDKEGYLFIQGRRSDMIKTGAHRVAPIEIEEVIGELRGVAEVAVVGVEDAILGQVIKAVIRREPGVDVDEMRVKAHCRDRLATYKIPKFVAFIEEFPKTASGKIQRYLLVAN